MAGKRNSNEITAIRVLLDLLFSASRELRGRRAEDIEPEFKADS
jgi:hypothetical protein